MYYLIRPDLNLEWINLPEGIISSVAEESNLGQLEWIPADRKFDEVVLALALRSGTPCSKGIAIAGTKLLPLDDLIELRNLASGPTELPTDDLIEALMPGSKEYGLALDQEIDTAREERINQATAALIDALAVPPADSLVQHWTSLGGFLPRALPVR